MSTNKQIILSLKDIVVKFNSRGITQLPLNKLSLDIFDGETIAFIGQSTSGKTTLCNTILNRLDFDWYISNGYIMYYPKQNIKNEKNNQINHEIDLIKFHKSKLKSITKKIILLDQSRIYDSANIKICYYKSEISKLQYLEAKRKTSELLAIYRKAKRMKSVDKLELIANDYAMNKTYSINNGSSPSVPLILQLIDLIKIEERIIADNYLIASQVKKNEQDSYTSIIKKSKERIRIFKLFISNIQIEIAKTNYLTFKKLKKSIKFIANEESNVDNEITLESLNLMYENNKILNLQDNHEIKELIKKIEAEEKKIDSVLYENSNFSQLSHESKSFYQNIINEINENLNDFSQISHQTIEDSINYINAQRFKNEFEKVLNSVLLKIVNGKKVNELEISYLLEDWKFKSQSYSKNKSETSLINETLLPNTISSVNSDYATNLVPNINIGTQIESALISSEKIPRSKAKAGAIELLKEVGIVDSEKVYFLTPSKASKGVNQLSSIALALAYKPNILVLDEPTIELGANVQFSILNLIKKYQKSSKSTILLFSNDLNMVSKFADRVVVMEKGEIIEIGLKDEIFNNPAHTVTNKIISAFNELNSRKNFKKTDNIFEIFNNLDSGILKNNYSLNSDEKDAKEHTDTFNELSKTHLVRISDKKSLDLEGGI